MHLCVLSCVRLFATPWTAARQAPLLMDSPGKNTGVGSHSLLQGIVSTQEPNPMSLVFPALAGRLFAAGATWELSTKWFPKLFTAVD